MPKKNGSTITGHLLTTIARTVGVTAGMIVNKTSELTEIAVQAAGATMKARSAKKSAAPKKRKTVAKKRTAPKKRAAKKSTDGA